MHKKLKYLMVMPRLVQCVGDGYAFPLGIAYVSSSLKAAGFDVFTLNLNHYRGTVPDLLKSSITKNQIDVVCTGGLSFQYSTINDIIKTVKSVDERIVTVVGGGLITAEPSIAMQALENANVGIVGEGEITICELAHALENNVDPLKVRGIVFKMGEYYHSTPPREEIQDLDALPWPDYEGFELSAYLDLPPTSLNNLLADRTMYIAGSRSCPYNCTFCFHSSGRKYRQRSIEAVAREIEFLDKHYHLGVVCMTDELFARDKARISLFSAKMKELDIPWTGSFRVDDVDEEIIDILKNGKCASMAFGLESADNRILQSMRKHITIEQIENALRMVSKAGIPFAGNFIFGDIEETHETARITLEWWERHSEYNIGLNLVATYPGSYIYKYACQKSIIKDRVQYLKDGCPQVNISRLSESEFSDVARQIYEAPYKTGKSVEGIQVYQFNSDGRLTIEAKCCRCKADNVWKNVKMFVGNSWLPCSACGQKHNIPMTSELKKILAAKISGLLRNSKKIAVWGITYYSICLLNDPIFSNELILFIDNASTKQRMKINGKGVYSPDELRDHDVRRIVVFYPNSYQQISSQIKDKYPHVDEIIDVTDFVKSVDISRKNV